MQIKLSNRTGFTLVEIMIVVAIIGLLAAAVVPNLVSSRKKAQKQTCINNLRTIKMIKAEWALTQRKNDADVPTDGDLVGADKPLETKPSCPAGGTYDYKAVGENPTCSAPGHVLE